MHAAVHGTMTYGCQLFRKSKFMQKCINYLVTSFDSIIIFNAQNSDVSLLCASHGLGGGCATFQTNSKVLQSILVSLFVCFLSVLVISPSPPSPPHFYKKKKKTKTKQSNHTDERTICWPYSLFEAIYGISF